MTELRFVLVADDKRRIQLPEGVPFEPGEPLHLLWDGNVLQISRNRPKRLADAFVKVQEDASRVLDTDALSQRLAQDRERQRKKFDEVRNQFFKDDPSRKDQGKK